MKHKRLPNNKYDSNFIYVTQHRNNEEIGKYDIFF